MLLADQCAGSKTALGALECLSYFISMKKAPDRMVLLKQIYEEDFKRIADFDRDRASYYAVPDTRLNY